MLAPPNSTLFPYTTLFRSHGGVRPEASVRRSEEVWPRTRARTEWNPGIYQYQDSVGSGGDRKSTRLNSSHTVTSYAVFCLKKITDPRPHIVHALSRSGARG